MMPTMMSQIHKIKALNQVDPEPVKTLVDLPISVFFLNKSLRIFNLYIGYWWCFIYWSSYFFILYKGISQSLSAYFHNNFQFIRTSMDSNYPIDTSYYDCSIFFSSWITGNQTWQQIHHDMKIIPCPGELFQNTSSTARSFKSIWHPWWHRESIRVHTRAYKDVYTYIYTHIYI